MSLGKKDESSGAEPKSSNQSEEDAATIVQGNRFNDQKSDSTIKPAVVEETKIPLVNKDMITKAYQAEV